jgi:hypothetical protein
MQVEGRWWEQRNDADGAAEGGPRKSARGRM